MNVIAVQEVLNTTLETFIASFSLNVPGYFTDTKLKTAYQNTDYSPTIGQPYIAAWHINGVQEAAALGDCAANRHYGLFQLDIYTSSGTGNVVSKPIINGLEEIFKRGVGLTGTGFTVKILSSNISRTSVQDPWYIVSFDIYWRTDLSND